MVKLPALKLVRFNEDRHLPKTAEEKLNDDFFILLTAYIGERSGLKVNRLNLQKTIFLTKLALHEKGIKFFNTSFCRHLYGPYQKRVHFSTQRLTKYSLIEKEEIVGNDIVLTNEGVNFLNFVLEKLPENEAFKSYFETTKGFLEEYSGDRAGRSIDQTHKMKVRTSKGIRRVEDLTTDENYYLEPEIDVSYKASVEAPQEAIANLANYREYSLQA